MTAGEYGKIDIYEPQITRFEENWKIIHKSKCPSSYSGPNA